MITRPTAVPNAIRTLVRRARLLFIVPLCSLLLLSACAKKKHRIAAPAPFDRAIVGSSENGIASWYGYPYHGRRAANGEIYDMEKLTAAHRTLPFGAWVEVQNLDNGKTVNVRITDRGPFIDKRIIDVSKAAARAIGMIGPGTANVRITVIAAPRDVAPVSLYAVQAGAFQDKNRAERLRTELEAVYGTATLVFRAGRPAVWRVLVGSESNMDAANALREKIETAGHSAFVVRLDEPEDPSQAAPPPKSVEPDRSEIPSAFP